MEEFLRKYWMRDCRMWRPSVQWSRLVLISGAVSCLLLMAMYGQHSMYHSSSSGGQSSATITNPLSALANLLRGSPYNIVRIKQPELEDIPWLNDPYLNTWNETTHVYTSDEVREYSKKHNRRFPDCLIVGSRKSGTGALVKFLRHHPNIATTGHEPEFFHSERHYREGLDYYAQKLPRASDQQVLIEKSANYFHVPSVPPRVKAFNKDMKIIIIVKDPYVRMLSDYLFLQRFTDLFHNEEGSHTIEELMVDQNTSTINPQWKCIKISVYYQFLEMWLQYFPREQIHIVDGDSFEKNNPGRELSKVEKFLKVKHSLTESRFYYDKTKGFYCSKRFGCLGDEKGHPKPVLPPGYEEAMRYFFAPFNTMFYELVGQNFGWKT